MHGAFYSNKNMSLTDEKAIAASIISFLKSSISGPKATIKEEESQQSLEVAIQCIQEVFGVGEDQAPVSLTKLYGVYKQTAAAATSTPSLSSAPKKVVQKEAEEEEVVIDKAKAEKLKSEGNKLLASKEFNQAVEKYTDAIAADPTNAVYYGNRAAAYSQLSHHELAVYDAKKALQINPDYSKAYSRLGHAEFCLGRYENAVDAYQLGLEKEPSNPSIKQSLAAAKQKVQEKGSVSASPKGNAPGGMPAGIPPNFASMMQDPNIMRMAQSMMSNPAMASMMTNPAMQSMLSGAGGAGGGMPDIASIMNNPQLAAMAENLMKDPSAMESILSNPEVAKMAKSLGKDQ